MVKVVRDISNDFKNNMVFTTTTTNLIQSDLTNAVSLNRKIDGPQECFLMLQYFLLVFCSIGNQLEMMYHHSIASFITLNSHCISLMNRRVIKYMHLGKNPQGDHLQHLHCKYYEQISKTTIKKLEYHSFQLLNIYFQYY